MTSADLSLSERELCRLTELLDDAKARPQGIEAIDAEESAEELRQLLRTQALLAQAPSARPPADFLRKTQRRLRRKSGGRFFHPASLAPTHKLTIEVFVVVAIVVIAACWIILQAQQAQSLQPQPLQVLSPAAQEASAAQPAPAQTQPVPPQTQGAPAGD